MGRFFYNINQVAKDAKAVFRTARARILMKTRTRISHEGNSSKNCERFEIPPKNEKHLVFPQKSQSTKTQPFSSAHTKKSGMRECICCEMIGFSVIFTFLRFCWLIIYPRLPNTLGLEVFRPPKHFPKHRTSGNIWKTTRVYPWKLGTI